MTIDCQSRLLPGRVYMVQGVEAGDAPCRMRVVSASVRCLRGDQSDQLLPEVAEAMRTRGPRAVVATIAGCGHAPALNPPEQISLVERFLAA